MSVEPSAVQLLEFWPPAASLLRLSYDVVQEYVVRQERSKQFMRQTRWFLAYEYPFVPYCTYITASRIVIWTNADERAI